jgi:hypothetical protein
VSTNQERCLQAIEKALRRFDCVLLPEVHIKGADVQISFTIAKRPEDKP